MLLPKVSFRVARGQYYNADFQKGPFTFKRGITTVRIRDEAHLKHTKNWMFRVCQAEPIDESQLEQWSRLEGKAESESQRPDESKRDAETEAGETRSSAASQDGHEDTDQVSPELVARARAVLASLDWRDDGNWTAGGLPKVSAVARIGGEDIKREHIAAAAPGWDREQAEAGHPPGAI